MKHSARRTPHSALQKGQALLELAIFGSLILMVLGVLVSYGLNADFSQQAMMGAFRRAMASAAVSANSGTPSSVTHSSIQDRHIPSPSHPFGIGSLVPIMGQAGSVTRNYRMHASGDTAAELPRTMVVIDGQPVNCSNGSGCTSAGFRTEPHPGNLDKYHQIFGRTNVCDKPACGAGGGTIRILDSCEGEVISYDGCYRQARMIVDQGACVEQCNRGKAPGSSVDCSATCSAPMNVPWYAQGAHQSGGSWVFPALTSLFAGVKALGIQQGSRKQTTMDPATLRKTETAGSAAASSTTTSLNWREEITRQVIYRDSSGNRRTQAETRTPKDEHSQKTWTTPW